MKGSLQDKSVLVTGACGFMGSHLVERLLAEGASILAVDRPEAFKGKRAPGSRYTPVPLDITRALTVTPEPKFDVVYHLAAIAAPIVCEQEPEKAFLTNVLGTYNVLRFALKGGAKKVVFLSSAHVYGISPKYMPTGEVHPLALLDNYCYDEQTECLTDQGWKRFVDLNGEEKVAQLDPTTGKAEMVTPSLYYKSFYQGPMYLYEGKSNFCVTPNHTFWYAPYAIRWARPETPFRLAPIEKMLDHGIALIDSTMVWKGQESETEFVLEEYVSMRGRGHGMRYAVQQRKMPMVPWLGFLGWYISEGCTSSEKYVNITQEKPERVQEIRETLNTLGWQPYTQKTGPDRNATRFSIGSVQLRKWIHKECYTGEQESSYTKKVPAFVKNLSPRLIEEFLRTYTLGDGTARTKRFGRSWTTYSKALADDIQELVLKTGKVATLSQRFDSKLGVPYWVIYERLRSTLQVRCRRVKQIQYSGLIGCVEVPSHIVMVRRKGKTMWCGNTTTKVLGEHLCSLFYDNHHLPYLTFRLFNSFGPGQPQGYFIPDMIAKAKTGHITLRGRQVTKDFVYIDDVVDALVRGALSDYVGEINIGSGKQTELGYVAKYIADKMHATIDFDDTKVSGPTRMQCDNTRARKILGWEPKTTLEKGLDSTIPA